MDLNLLGLEVRPSPITVNVAELILPLDPLAALAAVLQTLGLPTPIEPERGPPPKSSIPRSPHQPVSARGWMWTYSDTTSSNTQARLLLQIGQRQVGDLLYKVANLLNPDTATTLLLLLTEL